MAACGSLRDRVLMTRAVWGATIGYQSPVQAGSHRATSASRGVGTFAVNLMLAARFAAEATSTSLRAGTIEASVGAVLAIAGERPRLSPQRFEHGIAADRHGDIAVAAFNSDRRGARRVCDPDATLEWPRRRMIAGLDRDFAHSPAGKA